MRRPPILITGRAGYIGSHALVSLLEVGYDAVVLDKLTNADASVLPRVEALTGRKTLAFIEADVNDVETVERTLRTYKCGAIMRIAPRRAGDIACFYVDPSKAADALGWQVSRDLYTMCAHQWRWQKRVSEKSRASD